MADYYFNTYGNGWLNYGTSSSSGTQYTYTVSPTFITTPTPQLQVTSPPPPPETAVGWLRKRVNEICDTAFDEVAA